MRAPTGVVEADDGRSGANRQVHDLADLLGIGLGQGSAEDREILGKDEHQATADGAVAGDHAVTQRMAGVHPEIGAPMGDEGVELLETALVEDLLDAFPCGVLALGVLLLDPLLAAALTRLLAPVGQVENPAFDAHCSSEAGLGSWVRIGWGIAATTVVANRPATFRDGAGPVARGAEEVVDSKPHLPDLEVTAPTSAHIVHSGPEGCNPFSSATAAGTGSAAGTGAASSAGARHGHGYRTRPSVTVSATDQNAS
jgi:hypothetical protein